MSVYKEGFMCLETIESASKRIYPDACDFGALTNVGDKIWQAASQLVEMYKDENKRTYVKYATGVTVTNEVTIMDEWQTGDQFTYLVTYTGSLKGQKMKTFSGKFDGFIQVELIGTVKGNKRLDD